MTTVAGVAGISIILLVLGALARAVARDQRSRRDDPVDREADRNARDRLRGANAEVARTMLFGRWSGNGRRDNEDRNAPTRD